MFSFGLHHFPFDIVTIPKQLHHIFVIYGSKITNLILKLFILTDCRSYQKLLYSDLFPVLKDSLYKLLHLYLNCCRYRLFALPLAICLIQNIFKIIIYFIII
jgi:hypothetical protein